MKAGQWVRVLRRYKRRLEHRCNMVGGWRLNAPVEGFLLWNEDEMKRWRKRRKRL
jgi:hypothetical protein